MLARAELVVDKDVKYDALRDVSDQNRLMKIQEYIKSLFYKYIDTMSDEQIKNQMMQVINYTYNYLGFGKEDMASLMANFSMILSENTKDIEFLKSLKRSIDCTIDMDIKGHLGELKAGDNRSFVVANILTGDHAFNCIIYKKDNKNYKLVIANKGYRPRDSQYEAYCVSDDNIEYIIDNCLGFKESDSKISTQDVYNIIESKGKFLSGEKVNAHVSDVTYDQLKSRSQKNGNCFYKNAEAAFLLAWHTAFNKDKTAVVPKGPIDKKSMHIKFMENIKKKGKDEELKDLLVYVDKEIDVYTRNKTFREYLKKNSKVSTKEKRLSCVKIFLDEKKELSEVEVEAKIDDALDKVDLQTLKDNREIFLVSDHVDLVNVVCEITDQLKYLDFLDKEDMLKLKSKFQRNKDRLYKNFPNVADQLSKVIAFAMQGKVGVGESPKDNIDNVTELNKEDIMFYLANEDFSKYSKSKEERVKKSFDIAPNHKMARLEYVYVLMRGNKVLEALDECDKLILGNNKSEILMDLLEEILNTAKRCGKLQDVVARYKENVSKDDQNKLAHYGLGIAQWLSGDEDSARDHFDKACKLDFRYNEDYIKFLINTHNNDLAIKRCDEVLDKKQWDRIANLKANAIIKNAVIEQKEEDTKRLEYAKNVFTDMIEKKYKNEMEYFWRGMCNMELNCFDEAKCDFDKVKTLDDEVVELAIAYTYDLGYKKEGVKRCGDYLTKNPDNAKITLLEEDILDDIDKKIEKGEIDKKDVRKIFEGAVDEYNVDHFSEVQERRRNREGVCTKLLKDEVVRCLCNREDVSVYDIYDGQHKRIDVIVGVVKKFWQSIKERI